MEFKLRVIGLTLAVATAVAMVLVAFALAREVTPGSRAEGTPASLFSRGLPEGRETFLIVCPAKAGIRIESRIS